MASGVGASASLEEGAQGFGVSGGAVGVGRGIGAGAAQARGAGQAGEEAEEDEVDGDPEEAVVLPGQVDQGPVGVGIAENRGAIDEGHLPGPVAHPVGDLLGQGAPGGIDQGEIEQEGPAGDDQDTASAVGLPVHGQHLAVAGEENLARDRRP